MQSSETSSSSRGRSSTARAAVARSWTWYRAPVRSTTGCAGDGHESLSAPTRRACRRAQEGQGLAEQPAQLDATRRSCLGEQAGDVRVDRAW